MRPFAPVRPVAAAVLAVSICSMAASPAASFAQTCDPDTEARLAFIEQRLEEAQPKERLWWRSWMTVFVFGVGWGITNGVLEDNNEQAAADYVNAAKSVLGIADLTLRPHVGRFGAAPIRAIPKTSPESCRERLRVAEKHLEEASDAASMRWSWQRHLWSLTLNLGAAVAIAEGADEPERGWQDFAISETSAELHIWTHPTRIADGWDEYRTKFSGAPAAVAPSTLRFAAMPGGGVGVVWRF